MATSVCFSLPLDQAGAKRVSGHDGFFRVHKLIQRNYQIDQSGKLPFKLGGKR
jgi:hypothetical protein